MSAWVEAALAGPVHDVIIAVVPWGAASVALSLARSLAGRRGSSGEAPRVIGVNEPADLRGGNLGGTARAWREATAIAPWLPERIRAGGTALMLHDAGAATRSSPWSLAVGGRRGDLRLPSSRGPLDLRAAVARQLSPLAPTGAGHVDVAWTSQLFLPGVDPASLTPPTTELTKLVAPWTGDPSLTGAAELGWFTCAGDLAFSPGGTFPDLDAWRAAHAGRAPAADVGTFRISIALLEALAAARLPEPVDLDPGLTAPALRGDLGAPVLRALGGAPTVGVLPLGPTRGPGALRWWRLRRGAELLTLFCAIYDDPALRALLALDRPLTRVRLGDVWIGEDGPSWEELTDGVVIGGVQARRTILDGGAWSAGSRLDGVVAVEVDGSGAWTRSALLGGAPGGGGDGALVLDVQGAVDAHDEVVVEVGDAPRARFRLGLSVDPRAADELVLPGNPCSFAEARRRWRGG